MNYCIRSTEAQDYPSYKYYSSQSIIIIKASDLFRVDSLLLLLVNSKLFICIKVELYFEERVFWSKDILGYWIPSI